MADNKYITRSEFEPVLREYDRVLLESQLETAAVKKCPIERGLCRRISFAKLASK